MNISKTISARLCVKSMGDARSARILGAMFLSVAVPACSASSSEASGENAVAKINGDARTAKGDAEGAQRPLISAAAVQGKRLFLQCQACHAITPDAATKVGPNLYDIFENKAGTSNGYGYSQAMAQSDIVWTEDNLDAFIASPSTFIPGTGMGFSGVISPEQRHNLVAYLKSVKPE